MIREPHQHFHTAIMHNSSNKRKRDSDGNPVAPPTRIQTTGLETPRTRRISDMALEDGLSPRAAMSARLSGLNLRGNMSPTRRTTLATRRKSWSMHEDTNPVSDHQESSQPSSENVLEIEETPEPSVSIPESRSESEAESIRQRTARRPIFEFKAGSAPTPSPMTDTDHPPSTPPTSKQSRLSIAENPNTPSPSKRRRQESSSPSPVNTPIPRSLSPSARKLSKRLSISSVDYDSDSDNGFDQSALWWQDSEITGHDPQDPDEDNRGVNGIGYQKTKAEAWKISERRKKQIAEWRSREAKEARALRAGGRRTLMGRVTKSRSGSPVEQRGDRGRSSPGLKNRLEEEGLVMTAANVVRKGVRFNER